jgi:hypothetical protein
MTKEELPYWSASFVDWIQTTTLLINNTTGSIVGMRKSISDILSRTKVYSINQTKIFHRQLQS